MTGRRASRYERKISEVVVSAAGKYPTKGYQRNPWLSQAGDRWHSPQLWVIEVGPRAALRTESRQRDMRWWRSLWWRKL